MPAMPLEACVFGYVTVEEPVLPAVDISLLARKALWSNVLLKNSLEKFVQVTCGLVSAAIVRSDEIRRASELFIVVVMLAATFVVEVPVFCR